VAGYGARRGAAGKDGFSPIYTDVTQDRPRTHKKCRNDGGFLGGSLPRNRCGKRLGSGHQPRRAMVLLGAALARVYSFGSLTNAGMLLHFGVLAAGDLAGNR
jgi:hypothetical protein